MRSQAERGTPSPCGPALLSQWHWAAHSPVPSRDRAALPPHLAAQPCSTGETRAGGSPLLPAPPKGQAVPAAPALVLKKKNIPIKYPPQLSSHTDIAAGENESRQPPTHPSRASQARPPPYPLLYTPLAPFTPFTCHRGKASLRKSAQGERSPAHHTKTHGEGTHSASQKPATTRGVGGRCCRQPSGETSFHFEAESPFLPAAICTVQLCGGGRPGSARGSRVASSGWARGRTTGQRELSRGFSSPVSLQAKEILLHSRLEPAAGQGCASWAARAPGGDKQAGR